VQLLIHPAFAAGRFGFRLFHRGTQRALKLLERITGIGFLEDVSDFLLAFEGMADGFRDRAHRVRSLLLGPTSAFVLVVGPGGESARQATQFLDRLETHGVSLAGIIVNRIRLWPWGDPPSEGDRARAADLATLRDALWASEGAAYPAPLASEAAANVATGYAALVRSDARSAQPLRERIGPQGRFWARVPEFEVDVCDLAGLGRVADWIAGLNQESSA